jgi:hypothetical protein
VLDREVKALHVLARTGVLPTDAAERQLNTYLLVAGTDRSLGFPPRSLLLPLADAPQPGILPDLGPLIHRVMARDPVQCSLSAVLEQCIPPLRHTTRSIPYTDSQDVLLNVLLGLLLGLYTDNAKKTGFRVRARLFTMVHRLLTASREQQTAFCRKYEEVLILACMEYIARVVPLHMPAQALMLTHKDSPTAGFYKRIPPLCDELRQALDDKEEQAFGWDSIHAICSSKVAKVSRLKRIQVAQMHKESHTAMTMGGLTSVGAPPMDKYLQVPRLHNATPDEFRLLGFALHLNPAILQRMQAEVQINPLPQNLLRLQAEALAEVAQQNQRSAYLRARRYICAHCLLLAHSQKAGAATGTLRLDTLRQRLVCATCLRDELVCVNLLGRILTFRKHQYYLCPQCTTIQWYQATGRERTWQQGATCCHAARTLEPGSSNHNNSNTKGRKLSCHWCSEQNATLTVERVDHLTGEMVQFHYCQRHIPRQDAMAKCFNARRMSVLGPPQSRIRQSDPG